MVGRMRRRTAYPLAADYYRDMECLASKLLPGWQNQGANPFGEALLQVAAYMQGQVAQRLSQVPERDRAAFYRMLDIPAGGLEAAHVPMVFLLAEKQTQPLYLPKRTQVAGQGGDDEVFFETDQLLHLAAGRLGFIAATDERQDRIELIPPGFLALGPPVVYPAYRLSSFAAKGNTLLQVDPADQLEVGMVISLSQSYYRIAEVEDEFIRLKDPLDSDMAAETSFSVLTDFPTNGVLPDVQQHALYIGHNELFNLKGAAAISLQFAAAAANDPVKLIERLADHCQVSWQWYGKVEKEGVEGWQNFMGCPVTPDADACGLLCLGKPEGEVTEFEVNGQKSRWVRALLLPGAGGKEALHRPYLVEGVRLKVASMLEESVKNIATKVISTPSVNENGSNETGESATVLPSEKPTSLGPKKPSDTLQEICSGKADSGLCQGEKIQKALHNEAVLTVDGKFHPFGRVPQVQDRFVISAPEVLSKKGAIAGFNFKFVKGEILGFSCVNGDEQRAYAVTDGNKLIHFSINDNVISNKKIIDFGIPDLDAEFLPHAVMRNKKADLLFCKKSGAAGGFIFFIINRDEKDKISSVKELVCDKNDCQNLIDDEGIRILFFSGNQMLLISQAKNLLLNVHVQPEGEQYKVVLAKPSGNFVTPYSQANDGVFQINEITKRCFSDTDPLDVSQIICSQHELIFVNDSGLIGPIRNFVKKDNKSCYLNKSNGKISIADAWVSAGGRIALNIDFSDNNDGDLYHSIGSFSTFKGNLIYIEEFDEYFLVDTPHVNPITVNIGGNQFPKEKLELKNAPDFSNIQGVVHIQAFKNPPVGSFLEGNGLQVDMFNDIFILDSNGDLVDCKDGDRLLVDSISSEQWFFDNTKDANGFRPCKVIYESLPKTILPVFGNYQNPALYWEYYNGNAWVQFPSRENGKKFEDDTKSFRQSGCVSFTVPNDLSPVELAGKEGYWIRARLIGGDYGQPKYKVEESDTDVDGVKTQTITTDTSDLHPPEIIEVTASFTQKKYQAAEAVITENNLDFRNRTVASLSSNASFPLFEDVSCISNHNLNINRRGNYLYLGFTHSCELSPLSLWADVKELNEVPGEGELAAGILSQRGWVNLSVVDQTRALRQQGYIKVTVDETPVQTRLFGQYLFWLRFSCRLDQDVFVSEEIPDTDNSARDNRLHHAGWHPHLKALHMNATEALQARTVEQELVGSSNGEPNQVFPLSQPPVLAKSLELRVREQLDSAERDGLMAAVLPPDQPAAIARFDKVSLRGDWVLWQRVDSFIGQPPDARVYRLDGEQGKIQFSDSCQGSIPPAGSNNIRAIHYQNGGGRVGNLAAYQIDQLKSAVKFVDAVNNPLAARGGMDTPALSSQINMAPAAVRQGVHSTLAAPDIEAWLVAEFREVVLAKCLPPDAEHPFMRLIVLVANGEICPEPSMALRLTIRDRLLENGWGGLDKEAVEVLAPDYVPVAVQVTLNATHEKHIAWLKQQADTALKQYLHPVAPGGAAANRPFGRALYLSDLLQQLAGLGGLERIIGVQMRVFGLCRPVVMDAQVVASGWGAQESISVPDYGLLCADPRYLKVKVIATTEQEALCPSR